MTSSLDTIHLENDPISQKSKGYSTTQMKPKTDPTTELIEEGARNGLCCGDPGCCCDQPNRVFAGIFISLVFLGSVFALGIATALPAWPLLIGAAGCDSKHDNERKYGVRPDFVMAFAFHYAGFIIWLNFLFAVKNRVKCVAKRDDADPELPNVRRRGVYLGISICLCFILALFLVSGAGFGLVTACQNMSNPNYRSESNSTFKEEPMSSTTTTVMMMKVDHPEDVLQNPIVCRPIVPVFLITTGGAFVNCIVSFFAIYAADRGLDFFHGLRIGR